MTQFETQTQCEEAFADPKASVLDPEEYDQWWREVHANDGPGN